MRDSDEPIGYEHMNNSRIKKEDSNKRAERLWRIISTKSQNIGRHHIILHDTPVPHCHWTNNYRDSSVISSGFTRHFSGKRKAAKAPSLPHRIQVTTNIFNFDVPSSDVPAVLPHLMASIRTPEVSPYWRWKTNEAKWFELPFVIKNKVTVRDFKSCPLLLVTIVILISCRGSSINFLLCCCWWQLARLLYLLSVQPPSTQSQLSQYRQINRPARTAASGTAGSTIMYRELNNDVHKKTGKLIKHFKYKSSNLSLQLIQQ